MDTLFLVLFRKLERQEIEQKPPNIDNHSVYMTRETVLLHLVLKYSVQTSVNGSTIGREIIRRFS